MSDRFIPIETTPEIEYVGDLYTPKPTIEQTYDIPEHESLGFDGFDLYLVAKYGDGPEAERAKRILGLDK